MTDQTPEETPRELHLSPGKMGMTTKNLPALIEDEDSSVIVDKERSTRNDSGDRVVIGSPYLSTYLIFETAGNGKTRNPPKEIGTL